jgi:DNA polymerase-3 subunit alpha
MLISKELAGFTGAQADDLRKAIGKKNRAAMAKLEPMFREGCAANGVAQSTIDWLWATNEKSADYSFNKSHAACYALIAYRTAWLKANYCAEYMAALISSVMDTKDKVPFFAARCEEMGIQILPPDVNLSDHEFVVVDGNIRFGLDAVKGVGYAAVEAMKRAREEAGPFESIWDFCERVDPKAVNKRSIEALIKCGAFGSTGASRKGMLEVLEAAQGAGQKAQQDAEIGQGSIFDLFDTGGSAGAAGAGNGNGAAAAFGRPAHPPIPTEEFDKNELLAHEKDAIGLFLSMHPLKEVREALLQRVDKPLSELPSVKDGEWITAGGIITAARKLKTRSGNMMMFATLDDLEGSVELIFFGNTLDEYEHIAQVDQIVLIRGRVGNDDRGLTIKVQTCEQFQPSVQEVEEARAAAAVVAKGPEALTLVLDAARLPASIIEELKHVFGNHTGEADVVLDVRTSQGPRTLRLGQDFRVDPTPSLRAELARILGPDALAVATAPAPA